MTRRSYVLSTLVALLCGGLAVACGAKSPSGNAGTGGSVAGAGAGTLGTAGAAGVTAGTNSTAGAAGGVTAGTAGGTAGTTAGTGGVAGTAGAGGTGGAGGAPATLTCSSTTPKTGSCKAAAKGIYAMKVELDTWFMDEVNPAGQALLDPGRGKIEVYFKGEITDICEDGSDGVAQMHPCGTKLPYFLNSANCTALQIQFPDDLWDKPGVPTYTSKASTTGFNPGDTLTVARTSGLLGIDLDMGAAFPDATQTAIFTCQGGAKTGADCFPDADRDSHPGVTVTFLDDGSTVANPIYTCPLGPFTFRPAPLSVGGGVIMAGNLVASRAYTGLQTALGGSGKIASDCNSGVGPATAAKDLPSRVWDCLHKDNSACSTADAQFLDKNTPRFHVMQVGDVPPSTWKHQLAASDAKLDRNASVGPRSAVVRLGDLGAAVSCADIRNTTFPAFQ